MKQEKVSTVSKVNGRKSKALRLVLTGILAGVYAVSTQALGILSYGSVNLRLSNILIGVVPIVGWPSVFGITLGVFLSNIYSPLGAIDLVSAAFTLVGLMSIQFLRKRFVFAGFVIYSLLLSIWVTFELSFVFPAVSYFPTFYFVLIGISVVVIGLAYPFYRLLKSSSLLKRLEHLNA